MTPDAIWELYVLTEKRDIAPKVRQYLCLLSNRMYYICAVALYAVPSITTRNMLITQMLIRHTSIYVIVVRTIQDLLRESAMRDIVAEAVKAPATA